MGRTLAASMLERIGDWTCRKRKTFLLVNEQLRQSNRGWKALALAVCAILVLVALFGVMGAEGERLRVEAAMRDMDPALANAHHARVDIQRAANPILQDTDSFPR